MRSWWMLAAAGLLLAACRTDGDRGEAAPQDRGHGPPNKLGQVERTLTGANADEAGTARLLAATRMLAQAEVDAGKLAQQRATSPEVKDYAMRTVAELQADIDALTDLMKAKKIDLEAAAVVNDPVLKAERGRPQGRGGPAARPVGDRLRRDLPVRAAGEPGAPRAARAASAAGLAGSGGGQRPPYHGAAGARADDPGARDPAQGVRRREAGMGRRGLAGASPRWQAIAGEAGENQPRRRCAVWVCPQKK